MGVGAIRKVGLEGSLDKASLCRRGLDLKPGLVSPILEHEKWKEPWTTRLQAENCSGSD